MKDTILLYVPFAVTVVLISCSAPRNEEASADSTVVITEMPSAETTDNESSGNSEQPTLAGPEITEEETETQSEPAIATDLRYEGQVTDQESGYSQYYTLLIRPDLQSASIGGGPYNALEDQGNGVYMWIDGTIIGMSIRPMRDRCIVYGSEGDYFCTLYRR